MKLDCINDSLMPISSYIFRPNTLNGFMLIWYTVSEAKICLTRLILDRVHTLHELQFPKNTEANKNRK